MSTSKTSVASPCISATHGSIAAGRDVNLHLAHCAYRPCPQCELRLIVTAASMCNHCRRRAALRKLQSTRAWLVLAFVLCVCAGMALAVWADFPEPVAPGLVLTLPLFGLVLCGVGVHRVWRFARRC